VAQAVAVAGRAIELDLVRRATELDDRAFLDALDELHREEVVAVRELALTLHDPRLQDVIYQGLAAAPRAALHRRLAVELERRFGDDPRERSADLGRHLALGGDAARARSTTWCWRGTNATTASPTSTRARRTGARESSSTRRRRASAWRSNGSSTTGWVASGSTRTTTPPRPTSSAPGRCTFATVCCGGSRASPRSSEPGSPWRSA
jgi:hypothetical protein